MIDATEAAVNAAVGLVVSAAAVRLLWPVFGWEASAGQSVGVAALFFVLSALRAYALRKLFRAIEARA